ncbi:MAG: Holliday junction branch migration protein RuvA [Holosporales bacterium]|jgi:Holliday junction DNA helicase RuvA|nr:Holliday junction branch migration protein RuvA [Holosporales bacterium]
MIAKLKGIVDTIFDDSIVIDVGGVGYQVFVISTLRGSLQVGDDISIQIFHIFKQEMQYLCGFQNTEEVSIFKALLEVPGIGVKSAMSILSTLSIEEFALAVASQDAQLLCKTNGIGRKTAERILLELKDKALLKNKDLCKPDNSNVNDAILGLISLGYQKSSIIKIINEISQKLGHSASTNELIVSCLKEIK